MPCFVPLIISQHPPSICGVGAVSFFNGDQIFPARFGFPRPRQQPAHVSHENCPVTWQPTPLIQLCCNLFNCLGSNLANRASPGRCLRLPRRAKAGWFMIFLGRNGFQIVILILLFVWFWCHGLSINHHQSKTPEAWHEWHKKELNTWASTKSLKFLPWLLSLSCMCICFWATAFGQVTSYSSCYDGCS